MSTAPSARIIGLMSGTSLDGLDIACCRFENAGFDTRLQVECFETVPIPEPLRARLAALIRDRRCELEELTLLNAEFGTWCGREVAAFMQRYSIPPDSVDLVVSHGQTVYHAPGRSGWDGRPLNATLQIGDGDHVAAACGRPVLSDLRQKHVAAGFEGAPLAVYLDVLYYGRRGSVQALLNLGGIANCTVIDFRTAHPVIFTSDCGPANTLLDGYTRRFFNTPFDPGGEIAGRGQPDNALLQLLLEHPFYARPFPKSTGREEFHQNGLDEQLARRGATLRAEDVLATLSVLTARGIASAVHAACPGPVPAGARLQVSGGGVHNRTLMRDIAAALPGWIVQPLEGIHPDAKEAVLFALLGNEYLHNAGATFPWGPAALGKRSSP